MKDYSISKVSRKDKFTMHSQSQMIQQTFEGNGAKEFVINELISDDHDKFHGASSKGETLCKILAQGLIHDHTNLETKDLINKKSLTPVEYQRLSKKINDIQNELIEGMSHFVDSLKLRL